uniref:C2H2-type domain-containing protein n=1 Tax=Steinernema glaseri TaxID=37863 RepID=A0A1I7ZYD1_9BILA
MPIEPGDILERTLANLARSQANLEGSLANFERSFFIENTLSRLVESQVAFLQMVVNFLDGNDVPVEPLTDVINLPEIGVSPSSSEKKPASTGPRDIVQRSLDMLERSQRNLEGSLANLERTVAIENILSRLIDSQEELRFAMMTFLSGISVATSTDVTGLTVGDLDNDDTMDTSPSATVPEEEKTKGARYLTRGQVAAAAKIAADSSAEDSDDDEDEVDSFGSSYEEDVVSRGEAKDPDYEEEATNTKKPSRTRSAYKKFVHPEKLSIWKCAVCEEKIKGTWDKRRRHIQSHEGFKVPCPVEGCSMWTSQGNLDGHLKRAHDTTKGSLPAKEHAKLQREVDRIDQAALEFEEKYFPPSTLDSFAEAPIPETPRACRMCGNATFSQKTIRDHVGAHLNLKIQCPYGSCKRSGGEKQIVSHLRRSHGKTLRSLTKLAHGRFEEARKTFYEKVDAVMGDYFPELQGMRVPAKVNLICKKCGKREVTLRERRDHVGVHIHADFPCPFSDCGFSGGVTVMFTHLQSTHKTNLHSLTDEERGRYEDARTTFYEKVEAVMEEYFS